MIKTFYKFLFLMSFVFLVVGCSTVQVAYKTDKRLDKDKLNKNYSLVTENANVEISNRFLVYIPLTLMPVSADDTINKLSLELLAKYNADILTDVRIETGWLFTVYYNTYTYYLTANVWKRKED